MAHKNVSALRLRWDLWLRLGLCLLPLGLIACDGGSGGSTGSSDAVSLDALEPADGGTDGTEDTASPLDAVGDGSELGDAAGTDADIAGDPPDAPDSDADTAGPQEPDWHPAPLGASGDLHRVRASTSLGLRAVGNEATILRPHRDGWVREHAPWTDRALHDLAVDGNEAHAVGTDGLWLTRLPDGSWTPWAAIIQADLHGVALTDDGAIAVGSDGTVVRRTNDQNDKAVYEAKEPGITLSAIATAGDEAFAVGTGGAVRRRLGTGSDFDWVVDAGAATSADLYDLFVLESDSLWVVGSDGTALHFTGGWSSETTATDATLRGVAGAVGQLVAVGDAGTFLHRIADKSWPFVTDLDGPLLADRDYRSVALSGGRAVAVGEAGAIQSKALPDGAWEDSEAVPGTDLLALSSNGSVVGGAGRGGLVIRLDATGYGALETGIDADLHAVAVDENDTVWAAGEDGALVIVRRGAPPIAVAPDPYQRFIGLIARDGQALALGQTGALFSVSPGGGTSADYIGHTGIYRGLGTDGTYAVAFGESGLLVRGNPGSWQRDTLSIPGDLRAMASRDGQVIAVGDAGVIVTFSGLDTPTLESSDPTVSYDAVAFASDGSAWLAGWAGVLHRRASDGTITTMTSPSALPWHGVAFWKGAPVLAGADDALWIFKESLP